ncbi:hypothetical protein [Rhodosalinus halophilus]|uniref:hypothetical protein n=1 Tax=Rhodosalinus halophilus TaxID=2259333 RepID=UPI0011BF1712|nr:hypothetical protein [Rhodosalinus halophilus]
MAEEELDPLGGPALLDEERGGGLAQGVDAEALVAVVVGDAEIDRHRPEDPVADAGTVLRLAVRIGEDAAEVALGRPAPPVLDSALHRGRHGDGAEACARRAPIWP